MKRFLTIFATIAIVLTSAISPALAQTTATPTEDLLLRVTEGEGWSYATDADGQPIESTVAMMVDGEPQLDFAGETLALYERHEMTDAYAWAVDILPANYEPISTSIEIRVLTFSSEENATAFLGEFSDAIVTATPAEANLAQIDPLPETDLNLIGLTSMTEFTNYETDDSIGMAGTVRYLAQVDNHVISVDVAGPFVDYNFDLAYWLTDAQAGCITADAPCEAITTPSGEGQYVLHENGLGFSEIPGGSYEWTRWEYPITEPVTAPAISATIP